MDLLSKATQTVFKGPADEWKFPTEILFMVILGSSTCGLNTEEEEETQTQQTLKGQ